MVVYVVALASAARSQPAVDAVSVVSGAPAAFHVRVVVLVAPGFAADCSAISVMKCGQAA